VYLHRLLCSLCLPVCFAGSTQVILVTLLTTNHHHRNSIQPTTSPTTSSLVLLLMQAAAQYLPSQMLAHSHYPHPHLNGAVNPDGMALASRATRKRKRAYQYTVSYSEVQELDQEGNVREVIVIEDTPPPPPTLSPATTQNTHNVSASYQPPVFATPIRTRARAAAEAAGTNGSVIAPPQKKRRREVEDIRGAARKLQYGHQQPQNLKSWAVANSGVTEDVRDCTPTLTPFLTDITAFSLTKRRPCGMTRKGTTSSSQMT
jgi:hypothetical protein